MALLRGLFALLLALFLLTPSLGTAAPLGHQSYTYNEYGESAPGPDPYGILAYLDGGTLGCGPLRGLSDICFGPDGRLYIADTENNRIVVLDASFSLLSVLTGAVDKGVLSPFNQPRGVFAAADGTLYVADTMNARVVRLDGEGNLLMEFGTPQSDLIAADFNYRPLKICADESGRLYVVAASVNDGILLMNPSGSFEGFLAAARVNPDPIRMLWKRFATREQRSRMEDFVPVEYNSVELDTEGFVYATTAAVDEKVVIAEVGAGRGTEEGAVVRRLNMLGQDILRRSGYFPQVGDVENLQDTQPFFKGVSQIMDVAAGDNGCYYLLDNNRKRVFAYDQDGYLLYAFSGPGQSQGGFHTPSALAVRGSLMAVADRGAGVVTVFARTAYGEDVHQAIAAYARGDYGASEAVWKRVLYQNANMDMAYAGMGKAAYRAGSYKKAMDYFSMANLQDWYGKAFEEYRKTLLQTWFGPTVFTLAGLFIGWKLMKRLRRKKGGAL